MKAQRATVELGMLGGWSVVAGLAALLHAADRGLPRLGVLAGVLGALAIAGSAAVLAWAWQRLREIEGLPPTAQRVSPLWAAVRASLSAVLPAATVLAVSTASVAAGQTLGGAYVVLGAALCTAAVLATHVEYLCGARVWRCHSRLYFAR